MSAEVVTFEAGDVSVGVAAGQGARLASLVVGGRELLVTDPTDGTLGWGAYPMVPWAGRIDRGRFTFAGITHAMPITMAPHAIHGTGHTRPWRHEGGGRFVLDLDDPWPFGGHVVHTVDLDATRLRLTLEIHADTEAMPAMAGWHPWFRRPVELDVTPGAMLVNGDDMIPTGERVPPPPGPWDNCFVDLAADPVLRWPEGPTLTLSSNVDHWVVYTEPAHALCVEPQTGPPDEFNGDHPRVVEPGTPLITWFDLVWG